MRPTYGLILSTPSTFLGKTPPADNCLPTAAAADPWDTLVRQGGMRRALVATTGDIHLRLTRNSSLQPLVRPSNATNARQTVGGCNAHASSGASGDVRKAQTDLALRSCRFTLVAQPPLIEPRCLRAAGHLSNSAAFLVPCYSTRLPHVLPNPRVPRLWKACGSVSQLFASPFQPPAGVGGNWTPSRRHGVVVACRAGRGYPLTTTAGQQGLRFGVRGTCSSLTLRASPRGKPNPRPQASNVRFTKVLRLHRITAAGRSATFRAHRSHYGCSFDASKGYIVNHPAEP